MSPVSCWCPNCSHCSKKSMKYIEVMWTKLPWNQTGRGQKGNRPWRLSRAGWEETWVLCYVLELNFTVKFKESCSESFGWGKDSVNSHSHSWKFLFSLLGVLRERGDAWKYLLSTNLRLQAESRQRNGFMTVSSQSRSTDWCHLEQSTVSCVNPNMIFSGPSLYCSHVVSPSI